MTSDPRDRLLLVEDLMLLLHDDERGTIRGAGTIHYALGGAVLVELALGGHVEERRGRVHAVGEGPADDELLRTAHARIARRPMAFHSVVVDLMTVLGGSYGWVVDRLVEKDLLRREPRRVLGIFKGTTLRAQDPGYEAALLDRVRAVLADGVEPDPRTGALVALLSASNTLPTFHPAIRWSGTVQRRGKELERGLWGASAAGLAVQQTLAATTSAVAIAVGASAAVAAD